MGETLFCFLMSGLRQIQKGTSVLSVRFEVGVSLLLAPARADKRGPKAPFPLVENARIQPVTCKRVPAGSRVLLKALGHLMR